MKLLAAFMVTAPRVGPRPFDEDAIDQEGPANAVQEHPITSVPALQIIAIMVGSVPWQKKKDHRGTRNTLEV